jgi:hypothetical protein
VDDCRLKRFLCQGDCAWAAELPCLRLLLRLRRWLPLRLDRRLRGLLSLRLLLAAGAAVGEHLFELLLLRVSEKSFDAIAAVLHHSLHAPVAVAGGEGRVGAERFNLLLAIGEDGPDLCLLCAAEAKLAG